MTKAVEATYKYLSLGRLFVSFILHHRFYHLLAPLEPEIVVNECWF